MRVLCEERGGVLVRSGGDFLSHVYDDAVPSAAARLTAEFGMGSGVSRSLWPPDRIRAPTSGSKPSITCWIVHDFVVRWRWGRSALPVTGSDQAYRTISTGQLSALLRVHPRPIDVVVCHGPQGDLVLRGASRLDAFSGYPVRS